MKHCDIHNSLIFTPPRIAQVIVGRISSFFLIHLPLSAAKLRQFLFLAGQYFRGVGVNDDENAGKPKTAIQSRRDKG